MTTLIEIEGDQIRVIERTVAQTGRLVDILPHLENRPPIQMFHPRTAIFTEWDESDPRNKTVRFLCELSPSLRAIVKNGRRYRLSMPWTYFIFSFTSASDVNNGAAWSMEDHKVFHSNAQVTGPDSRLWTAFLPNVYEEGNICFGSTGTPIQQPLSSRVDQLVNTWYLTEFNGDVIGGRYHPLPFNGGYPTPGFRPWVDATAEHGASAWLDFPEWADTTSTIGGTQRGATSWTVRELLMLEDDRLAPRTVVERIPVIPSVPTFGAAEEWLRGLTPIQRARIGIAYDLITTESPELIAPVNLVTNAPAAIGEDGGEPI